MIEPAQSDLACAIEVPYVDERGYSRMMILTAVVSRAELFEAVPLGKFRQARVTFGPVEDAAPDFGGTINT